MSYKVNVEIISARPEDTDFIAWIVAQGMHLDSVPAFLKKLGTRDDTLYSWQNTRLLRCDGKLAYPKLAQLYTSYGFVPEGTFLYFDTLCRKMSLSI